MTDDIIQDALNKSGPAEVGAPLKFLEYTKDTIWIFKSVSQCQKYPKKYA